MNGSLDRRKLFEYSMLVGLRLEENAGGVSQCVPYIKWQYPEEDVGGSNRKSDPLAVNITEFCFPDAYTFAHKRDFHKRESFSFVLTKSTGTKRWGYCRRTLDAETGLPQCFCLLTFLPCFSIFSDILDVLVALGSKELCLTFCATIIEKPLPSPGGCILVMLRNPKGRDDEYIFKRPNDSDSLFDKRNFEELLQRLEPFHLLAIFASLLLERRIIFVAERLGTLSSCIQASVALLYPFTWQHIFIPVLPPSMMSFVCAPMPFFIGILSSSLNELKKMAKSMEEEVIIIDIDNSTFLSKKTTEDFHLLPAEYTTPLLEKMSNSCKSIRAQGTIRGRLRKGSYRNQTSSIMREQFDTLTSFFIEVMSKYQDLVSFEEDKIIFNKAVFVQSKPPEIRPFLEVFTQSQMFEMFIQERGRSRGLIDSGEFEQRLRSAESNGLTSMGTNDLAVVGGPLHVGTASIPQGVTGQPPSTTQASAAVVGVSTPQLPHISASGNAGSCVATMTAMASSSELQACCDHQIEQPDGEEDWANDYRRVRDGGGLANLLVKSRFALKKRKSGSFINQHNNHNNNNNHESDGQRPFLKELKFKHKERGDKNIHSRASLEFSPRARSKSNYSTLLGGATPSAAG